MAKKSLIISEKEKYGSNSPTALTSSKNPKESKYAPTIELTASQIAAFGLEDPKQGDTGCAKVYWRVKTVSDGGDSYGDRLPEKSAAQKVSLTFTHVEECEPGEETDEAEGEEDEKPDEGDTAGAADEDDGAPVAAEKETLSPKAAGLDDDE